MSPLTVRRYRAERLLRKEFEGLRGRVLGAVRGRLRASGVSLDASDLEACYAQAWQGLYAAMLAGEEIANPTGWLVLVTYRRAIEEHRARRRVYPTAGVGEPDGFGGERAPGAGCAAGAWRGAGVGRGTGAIGTADGTPERDLAGDLDDRIRLRQLFEGLRGRLSAREQQAAALCYLQGLSRSEAAARIGISEARMRKLMEGSGPGRPGVAGKVGELVETIRDGGWCEQQGSLMRGLAFGILDPEGERYRLAVAHRRECPACRAYVLSLRGLAAVLPPTSLPLVLGAGAVVGAGAAGVGGAAGGGWALAGGSVGAKFAVGCLVALSVGAGCVALSVTPDRGLDGRASNRRRHSADAGGTGAARATGATGALAPGYLLTGAAPGVGRLDGAASDEPARSTPALTPAAQASREFGPEQALAQTSSPSRTSSSSSSQGAPSARTASAGGASSAGSAELTAPAASVSGEQQATRSSGDATSAATSAGGDPAEREFGIG